MSEKQTSRFLTVPTVINDHGGEVAFWSQWLAGELASPVMSLVRDQAHTSSNVPRWLAVVDSPQAHKARAVALEMVNHLVESAVPYDAVASEEITDFVNNALTEDGCPPVRNQLRQCLFELLDTVELPRPPEQRVQKEATALLDVLIGTKALRQFQALNAWLEKLRGRTQAPTKLDRLLEGLTPELVERKAGLPRYRLSYRLFLRDRFRQYAEKRGWVPMGPRFRDLDSAFDALTRERIGELAESAVRECESALLRRAWRMVLADVAA